MIIEEVVVGSFVPHTEAQIERMLAEVGLASLEELYASIPASLRLGRPLELPPALAEVEVLEEAERRSRRNAGARRDLVVFAGGGAYDHDVPSAVRALALQSAFVTAYTPYQPEVSQGVLQALFEFQTSIARLFGMDLANASLYDGAAAVVEAVNLAVGATKRNRIVVSQGIHPRYRGALATLGRGRGLELVSVGLRDDLATDLAAVDAEASALVIGYPNALGRVEDLREARRVADAMEALLVVVADPVACALLEPPGSFGADVVVAEGQSLGIPLSFGGPYLGLFATRSELVRLVPGRLVGQTVDVEGRRGFVTTLRTREQDIRRERATSNVCTNQTLLAIWAGVYLAWRGKQGMVELARSCYNAAHYLADRLEAAGLSVLGRPFVREFVVDLEVEARPVRERLLEDGWLAGVLVPEEPTWLVLTATEARTREEIDAFVDRIAKEVR
ncbi:aminomethyl-transferring glycine dehydrogenase subunit GcvPA [Acidimicrobium ferrooxidans]|uniref:aminomethyl-transferring glycine dehydrogenase subunit GcvPA n=1 Tax=Acidimicrobium ferrooxidans TaxID=53635 RepID=UPI00019DE4C8|nr:aminomethyl-transferring glycine dehydrogenase subunit GcvPA [Acidimicrobium ferrooxidans]